MKLALQSFRGPEGVAMAQEIADAVGTGKATTLCGMQAPMTITGWKGRLDCVMCYSSRPWLRKPRA